MLERDHSTRWPQRRAAVRQVASLGHGPGREPLFGGRQRGRHRARLGEGDGLVHGREQPLDHGVHRQHPRLPCRATSHSSATDTDAPTLVRNDTATLVSNRQCPHLSCPASQTRRRPTADMPWGTGVPHS
ncbi:hypothetical protein T484DRAFT_2898926 [Baffinella frigidus]|nr:hypothetical protein T484DRAFT_2898926 [Cryptophyta sp. CCMP2293]